MGLGNSDVIIRHYRKIYWISAKMMVVVEILLFLCKINILSPEIILFFYFQKKDYIQICRTNLNRTLSVFFDLL